jgi:Bacterial regulatory proteins, luxR family
VRNGAREVAATAFQQLSERTRLSGTEWALGVEARSQALLSDDETAEELYVDAIERLERSRIKVHHARALLLYGEWLRRQGRRVDAREQLRRAHEMFAAMGADGFAERAERELLATGERARKRTPDTRGQLTTQEMQIALLARDGLSNSEIGTRLFLSPRTVEYHLHKCSASSQSRRGRNSTWFSLTQTKTPGAGRLGSPCEVVGDQRRRQDKREDGCEEEKYAQDGDERRCGVYALVLGPVQIANVAFDGADGST